MSDNWLILWISLALIIISFALGVQLTRWWHRRVKNQDEKVNQDYFRGLNYVLNEEPDKAIEVFIKALEVDSETVELHLALGGLFRRKGQVDRATRIHQNLVARPSLTDDQRLHAIFELAQDYYKAGLLDRAEGLFKELKESASYREQALQGLCNIYQHEKEWRQAIDVSRQHARADRHAYHHRTAHYWCELAELSIKKAEFDDALRCLRSALSTDRSLARAVLLRGELHFQRQEYRRAVSVWQSLVVSNPTLASLVIENVIVAFNELGDRQGLSQYLENLTIIPREMLAFKAWYSASQLSLGEDGARSDLFERVRREGLSGPVADYLFHLTSELSSDESISGANQLERELQLLAKDLLDRAKRRRIEYTCERCGFETRYHYWLCQNCGEWDSFSV